MTIVAKEDTRNAEWKSSNIGSTLLKNMGWTEGQGLGRRRQGTAVALRAVRRAEETLGIGARVDATGTAGWGETNDSFHSVLQSLHKHHRSGGTEGGRRSSSSSRNDDHSDDSNSSVSSDKKKKKSKKQSKKKELVLARNKVTAGHAQKMRHAKDLSTKSEHDMRAIFGGSVPRSLESAMEANDKKKTREKKKRKRDQEFQSESSSKQENASEKQTTDELNMESTMETKDNQKKEKKKRKRDQEVRLVSSSNEESAIGKKSADELNKERGRKKQEKDRKKMKP